MAISLPDGGDVPAGWPGRLTLVVGGLEFAGFRQAVDEASRDAPPGTRTRVVAPGTEHVSVLFAPRTHAAVLDALPNPAGGPPPSPLTRRPAPAAAGGARAGLRAARGVAAAPGAGGHRRSAYRPVARRDGAGGRCGGRARRAAADRPAAARRGRIRGGVPAAHRRAAGRRGALRATPPATGDRWWRPPAAVAVVLLGYAVLAVALPLHLGLTTRPCRSGPGGGCCRW
ncbi:hypothetical protein V2I01_21790 [Micromonospora sp. BRA006-A]|nr:hypothetical protein [Micromonospora sp. BRA006-A]